MVGLVGFELAARVALEVAPVRLGRFRPRLASAQPPDLGGEQLAQADGYQPPSYEPVNPERRTAQTPSDGLI